MAELLSTVCVAYACLTVASWWIDPLTERWIVVGVAGTAIPDLVKIQILIDPATIRDALGIPFSFAPLSTVWGVLVVAGIITMLFARRHWRRVYVLLVVGGGIGLLVDGMRAFADGRTGFYLYPVWWRPPTPSLFVSSDPRVLVVTGAVAVVVFLLDRFTAAGRPGPSSP